ncbi:MAG: hypothetical protein K2L95_00190 [Alphaproteobacteria bacterium]|nr:hypothetical protein [Alphaproteobacteria bacterium]MDE6570628.1 hypothetical protein [Alphaproteobacteria bacterium]
MHKYCVFLLCALFVRDVWGAPGTTCVNQEIYTSCNAGYYLKWGTCVACPAGTYKNAAGTATACTTCPSLDGFVGTTKSTVSTAVTACYIPVDSVLSDERGIYTFTNDCFY